MATLSIKPSMYGIFSYDTVTPRLGYKHGEFILDLVVVSSSGYFNDLGVNPSVFAQPVLNDFIALGKPVCPSVGQRIKQFLNDGKAEIAAVRDQALIASSRATMHLPVRIGDYTDFYAGGAAAA